MKKQVGAGNRRHRTKQHFSRLYPAYIAETQEEIEEEENPTIRQTQGKERKKEKKVSTTISPSHLTIMAAIIVDWLDTPE